ncbi:MAG: hypothetical protein HY073_03830 [Deltaproteobacteria bacterium]|nr:hypothetical protein [Deltaproteobacteria bacterium]
MNNVTPNTPGFQILNLNNTMDVLTIAGNQGQPTVNPNPPPTINQAYMRLISGYPVQPGRGTILVPIFMPVIMPSAPVAANQQAKVEGDPHFTEADGGHFDFQGEAGKTYNLINDSGFTLNAKFQTYNGNNNLTTMGEIGGLVSGVNGSSLVKITANGPKVTVNGSDILPGQSVPLADGGLLTVSADSKTVTFNTKEGYQNTVTVQGTPGSSYLDYSVKSSSIGVDSDGKMPGGLVGQTFDGDGAQRNGKTGAGAQGEGAIQGTPTDYEVPGGIYGAPQPQIMKPGAYPNVITQDPTYYSNFGIPVGTNPLLISSDQIQDLWNNVMNESTNQMNASNNQEIIAQDDAKSKKLQMLIQLALQSGNVELAMLLMASLESQSANSIAGGLMTKIQGLQDQRQEYANQMAGLDGNQKDASQVGASLSAKIGGIQTDITMLQTFLQEVMSQKRDSQQMACNMIKSDHDTAQAIIRNMG